MRRSRVGVRRQVPPAPAVLLVLVAVVVLAVRVGLVVLPLAAQEDSRRSLVGGQPVLAVAPLAVQVHAPETAHTPGPLGRQPCLVAAVGLPLAVYLLG